MAAGSEAREWTIGDVARRAGLATSALRYYEAAGVLPAPERTEDQEEQGGQGGQKRSARRRHAHRRYDQTVFLRVALIQVAQAVGFSVPEIALFVGGVGCAEGCAETPLATTSERWRELAEAKLPQIEAVLARATEMKRILETGLAQGCIPWSACALTQETAERYQQADQVDPS
jgi:MerR family transcriptional regulator, redox-sensitive transcriptional activator SoxR